MLAIVGYPSVWNSTADTPPHRVRVGAFSGCLRQRVQFNIAHVPQLSIDGKLTLSQDDVGLLALLEFEMRGQEHARQLVNCMRDGLFRSMSFHYAKDTAEFESGLVSELVKVNTLIDVCVCEGGAHPAACCELLGDHWAGGSVDPFAYTNLQRLIAAHEGT